MFTCPTVFGVDLEFLLKREAPDGVVIPGALPSMIENCLAIVERRGLSEVGICECLNLLHLFVLLNVSMYRPHSRCELRG